MDLTNYKRKFVIALTMLSALTSALYAKSGPELLWTFTTDVPGSSRIGKAAQFGLIDNGQLYASSYNGYIYQLDQKTGVLQNRWTLKPDTARAYSSPLMIDGVLYVYNGDRNLYRLDKTTPPQAINLTKFSYSSYTPTRVEALGYDSGSGLFFLGAGDDLRAVNTNGDLVFTLPHGNAEWGQPMSCDGMLYTYDTHNSKIYKYAISNQAAVAKWNVPFGCMTGSTAYLSKGVDGDGDTMIFAVSWADVTKTNKIGQIASIYDSGPLAGTKKWSVDLNHRIKHTSLWEGHDILVIPAQNGKIEWRRASTGEFIKEIELSAGGGGPSSPWSQVVISGNYGIFGTHNDTTTTTTNYMFVIDLNTGAELWKSDPLIGCQCCMIPILSDGIAIIGTYDAGVWYAYDLGDGKPFPFARFANDHNTGNVPDGLTKLAGTPTGAIVHIQ